MSYSTADLRIIAKRSLIAAWLLASALAQGQPADAATNAADKKEQSSLKILRGSHAPRDANDPEELYSKLCLQLRQDDAEFNAAWRKASADHKRELRQKRMESQATTLAKINELTEKIAKKRRGGSSAPNQIPVPVAASPDEAIKGMTTEELQRMGVDVRALHKAAPEK